MYLFSIYCAPSYNKFDPVFDRLLGRSSAPRYVFDREDWDGQEDIKRMTLAASSNLYSQLCAEDGNGDCTYPTKVTLADDLNCDGLECDVDTVRVVQVSPNVFYEYVRRPCTHHAFLDPSKSKTVFAGGSGGASMCAHESQPVGTNTCCPSGGDTEISCVYNGEYVTYDTNMVRCGGDAIHVCPAGTNEVNNADQCKNQVRYASSAPRYNHFQWTSGSCDIKIKVRLDGMVALVHVPQSASKVVKYVGLEAKDNMNFFHVSYQFYSFCCRIVSIPSNVFACCTNFLRLRLIGQGMTLSETSFFLRSTTCVEREPVSSKMTGRVCVTSPPRMPWASLRTPLMWPRSIRHLRSARSLRNI